MAYSGLPPDAALRSCQNRLKPLVDVQETSLLATRRHQTAADAKREVSHETKHLPAQTLLDSGGGKTCRSTRDNGTDSRGNAGAGNREPAVPSTPVGSDQGDTLLDVSEVADYLRISRSSVYKLIERQQIPAIRIGRLLRVRKDELDKTLRSMGSGA